MAELYQLRVVLCGVSPLVWRRLLISTETSIAELHEILQLAFDDELRESVQRMEAYQEFQPERFERRQMNRQLRAVREGQP